ncbi:hypothetical protein I4U23_015004 [Adineta vaga]|nr:hypothetical protein I4U23_015004 [Adineta vaga]
MLFNTIHSSDVRPGDHLYRYRFFEIQEGIAVQCSQIAPICVITYIKDTFQLLTLNEFKGRSCLRRVIYKQSNNCIKRTKKVYNRPPEEIAENALLLLEWIKTSPDRVRTLFSNDLSQFARQCCTTVHEQWRTMFQSMLEQTSSKKYPLDKEKKLRKSKAFNVALLCGMPFRQASQIGNEEFWNENCTSQDENDSINSVNDDDEHLLFLPTSNDYLLDEDVSLI